MTHKANPTRRAVLAGVSATALIPLAAMAQGRPPTFVDFAVRARAISGFDTVPRRLLRATRGSLDDTQARAFIEGHDGAADLNKSVLKALYTGIYNPQDSAPTRFAYADALMYSAIKDAVNVPSYCGGLPGYWAEKPAAL